MKLRANKNISKYKDKDHYLDAVYRKNKDYINAHIKEKSKSRFKALVKSYMAEGNSVKKSLDIVQKSAIFTTREEHNAQNAYTALKKNKKEFYKFRKLAGWKKKIDLSQFAYAGFDGKNKLYSYGDVIIAIGKSPKNGAAGIQVGFEDEIEND